jgi:hypothetical protein
MSECIFIVNAFLLRKARVTSLALYFSILPFGTYHILALRSRKYFPYIILYYGLVFFYHGICPFFLLNGFFKEGRLLL